MQDGPHGAGLASPYSNPAVGDVGGHQWQAKSYIARGLKWRLRNAGIII